MAKNIFSDKSITLSRRRWVLSIAALGVVSIANSSKGNFSGNTRNTQNSSATSLNPSEEPGTLCSNRNAIGVGLRGEYFTQANWLGEPLEVRTDEVLDSAALQFSESVKSVRWRGWVKASRSGPHRFHFDHPHARITVAKSDFSFSAEHPAQPIALTAGRFYDIALELPVRNNNDATPFRLEWTPPHGYRYPIVRSMLFLPTG